MGRAFLTHIGTGTRCFNCKECGTNLTSRDELISTRFTGEIGKFPAYPVARATFFFDGEGDVFKCQ